MLQMIKREYVLNKLYFIIVLLFLPFIYLLNMSPIFIYCGIVIGHIFNLFYYDHHNKLNHFIVSMPIKKNDIVLGRYVSSLIVSLIFLLYLWFLDISIRFLLPLLNWLPKIEYKPITANTIIGTFLLITVIVAVSIPIYYFFQSVIKSVLAQVATLFIMSFSFALFGKYINLVPESFIHTIFDTIENQPYIVFTIFSFICWFGSYLLSKWIFLKRDLV